MTRSAPVARAPSSSGIIPTQQASSHLHIFWVMLAGLSQLFFINVLADVASQAGWPQIILHND